MYPAEHMAASYLRAHQLPSPETTGLASFPDSIPHTRGIVEAGNRQGIRNSAHDT